MKRFIVLLAVCTSLSSYGQVKKLRYQEKKFQLSLVPGISSHGVNEAWYFNKFSFNILGGISAGSRHLEIAGISNLNLWYTTGIQIAGIANVVGANSYINLTIGEERAFMKEEKFERNLTGMQFSGFLNYVRENATGSQITGGFNSVEGSLTGLQIAGLASTVRKSMVGVQVSGVYNIATETVGGLQLSALMNYTNGTLYGLQIGTFNRTIGMAGKRSQPPFNKARSIQIGLVNYSKNMDGWQIGLVNIGGKMRGKQIGLINLFSKSPPKDSKKNGTPIGLLNIGSSGSAFRVAYNEVFIINMEYSTGNCANCSATQYRQPMFSNYQKFNQNLLLFSYNPKPLKKSKPAWAVGYGFERLAYVKYSMFPKKSGPQNGAFYFSYGVKVKHLNWSNVFDPTLSLQSSIFVNYGRKLSKVPGLSYLYVSISINEYMSDAAMNGTVEHLPAIFKFSSKALEHKLWPGYSIGFRI